MWAEGVGVCGGVAAHSDWNVFEHRDDFSLLSSYSVQDMVIFNPVLL
jgi:hypothetical protein